MSFDLSWLESDGSPGACVSLNPDEHHAIIGQVSTTQYRHLTKLRDYYRDADFTVEELTALREEFGVRLGEIEASPLREKIKRILALMDEAISKGKAVVAIAD